MGLSHQFETQHDNPFKVSYVRGGWLSNFVVQEPSPALPISPPAASADAISFSLVGVSSSCGTCGLSPALTFRLSRSPSSQRAALGLLDENFFPIEELLAFSRYQHPS